MSVHMAWRDWRWSARMAAERLCSREGFGLLLAHRDVKPQAVAFTRTRQPQFGAARTSTDGSSAAQRLSISSSSASAGTSKRGLAIFACGGLVKSVFGVGVRLRVLMLMLVHLGWLHRAPDDILALCGLCVVHSTDPCATAKGWRQKTGIRREAIWFRRRGWRRFDRRNSIP